MITSAPHRRIQHRIGWTLLISGIVLALINVVRIFQVPDHEVRTNVVNAVTIIVFALVLFGISRIDRPFVRIAQVVLFLLLGYVAMFLNTPVDMTGMAFVVYAIFLASQYSFLRTHFYVKVTSILIFTLVVNVSIMFLKGEVDLMAGVAGVIFIGLFLLLLWIAFAENLKSYADRARELELERRKDSVFVRFGRNTAGLVHNLRNLVSVASGFNDLIRSETDEDYIKLLAEREHAAFERMSGTIARTLAIVKAKRETSTRDVDLNEIVAGLADFLNTDLAFKRHVNLELDLEQSSLIVIVQPLELCEVIENLIRNSWEAMEDLEANSPRTITVETYADPGIGFRVSDNGPGMPGLEECTDDECRNYFEVGRTTKRHGTGLGVPFVLEAARSNGWHVRIANVDGSGLSTEILLSGKQDQKDQTA